MMKTNQTHSKQAGAFTRFSRSSFAKYAITGLSLALLGLPSAHALELPVILGDGMVVQANQPIPVWGRAEPGSEVRIRFDEQVYFTTTGPDGDWQVFLPEQKPGGPFDLAVEGDGDMRVMEDIWAGDVWICSGQSNMEWPLESADGSHEAIASANDHLIRHFKVPKSWAPSPRDDLAGGSWHAASPDVAGSFTAVGYYFARRIRSETGIPIGLINATWGGSSIEAWMDASMLGLDPDETENALNRIELDEHQEAERYRQQFARWPGALGDGDEPATADWSGAGLDASDWIETEVPSLWENAGFMGLDGVAWFRKSFSLSAEQAGQDLELGLARIDDHDVTYVNGQEVGSTRVYNEVRRYAVDHSYLHEGVNTIAIRVFDSGGGGGIYSEPELLYLRGDSVDLSLAGTWLFKVEKGTVDVMSERNRTPTALYNRMLHPLFKVPVKGVIWYQGEENASAADRAFDYREQFKMLIAGWREKWEKPSLPFYWAQLANFISGADTKDASPWAILRESQAQARELPHTGQAVIIDVGDPGDIHPRDKLTVGTRLALHALKNDYGQPRLVADGPYAIRAHADGNRVVVEFETGSVLGLRAGDTLEGFELVDDRGEWFPATGAVNEKIVTVASERIDRPTGVRYGWSDNPENANLTDGSGLPASPFRMTGLQSPAPVRGS